ncbi:MULTISPECIES: transcriptional regulator SlyA [Cobetia]|uniref:transcriptional regulator SlyA n=1 Tax=Cobetia TaxID=204286 RepID=UPI00254F9EEC|nr:transcriptional regulator SlyA [Cobetia amphilecti]
MHEDIGLKLSRLPRLWRAILDQRLSPLGLTQTRWMTLVHLWRMGDGQPQCDLARSIGIEAPSLVRTLDQLTEQGLVERRACEEDRRTKRIFLTRKALPLIEKIDAIAEQTRIEMLEGLSETQVDQFCECLRVMERNGLEISEKVPESA